jgi:hypothetical protein
MLMASLATAAVLAAVTTAEIVNCHEVTEPRPASAGMANGAAGGRQASTSMRVDRAPAGGFWGLACHHPATDPP